MIPIFAEEWSAPNGLVSWEECLFFFVALIGGVIFTYRQAVPKKEKKSVPQPLITRSETIYAEKAETDKQFQDVHSQISGVRKHFDAKLSEVSTVTDGKLTQMAKEAAEGRRILHNEVKEVRQEMAEIPEQTINLLLKTKELNRE